MAALRECLLFDALRDSRELFSKEFPLTPALWTEWIRDEETALGGGRQANAAIGALYARACADYFSAELWTRRIAHVVGAHKAGWVSESDVRKMFEEACEVAGRAISTGAAVWAAYREFEESIENNAAYSSFRLPRQLAIPMVGSEQVMEELENLSSVSQLRWEAACVPPSYSQAARRGAVSSLCTGAVRDVGVRREFPAETEKRWLKYLDFERRSKAPVKSLLALYDRAPTPCALSARIWWDYTVLLLQEYVNAKGEGEIIDAPSRVRLDMARSRAVRNITYSGPLWSAYLLTCEARGLQVGKEAATAAVEEAMKRALAEQLSTPECYSTLWLAYLRALVRLQRLGSDAVSSAEIEGCIKKGVAAVRQIFTNHASSAGRAITPLLKSK